MEYNGQNLVSKVQASFSSIERSIKNLKDCSNKDFKWLAGTFDQSVKSVKQLVDLSKSVFSIVEQESSAKLISDIENVFHLNESFLQEIRQFYLRIADLKSNTDFMQNLFLVYIESCIQDLKTFTLLGDNMVLSESYVKNSEVQTAIGNMAQYAFKSIHALKNIYAIQNSFREQIDCFVYYFNEESFQTIGFADHPCHEAEREFKKKQLLVEENSSIFAQRESSHSNAFSEIVTNLQYNDIISQKIEHVSEIISNVSVRLKHIKLGEKDLELTLPNVKKAVELQSAQLVQINIDYQEAVKVIFKRLEELSENAADIALLIQAFRSKQGRRKSYFSDLLQHLSLPEKYFETLKSVKKRLNESLQQAQDLYVDLDRASNTLVECINGFVENKDYLSKHVQLQDLSVGIVSGKVAENMSFVRNAVSHFNSQMLGVFKLGQKCENLSLEQLEDSYISLDNTISSFDTTLHGDIELATNIAETLQKDVDSLLEKVSYYSMFESEAEFISKEMNAIVQILQSANEDVAVDSDFFDSLKQYYTMKSEHDIHDTVLLLDGSGDNDFDDVEFF